MAAVVAVVGPLVALVVGTWLRRVLRPSRRAVLGVLGAVFAFALLVAALSPQYPGPEGHYNQGSFSWAVRHFVIAPGITLLLTIPSLIALAGASIPQERSRGVIVGGLAAYGSMPPLVLLLLFVGCNYAGACL